MYIIYSTSLFCWTITLSFNLNRQFPPCEVQVLKLCLSEIRNQRWANSRRGIGQNLGCFQGFHRVAIELTRKACRLLGGVLWMTNKKNYVNMCSVYVNMCSVYVNMCICIKIIKYICYRVIGKMHLDEFGVNTIGNPSKPVCLKYPGLSWKTFNVLFLQPFSVQGGSHRKHQQEMWLPWMWHQTTCFLQW